MLSKKKGGGLNDRHHLGCTLVSVSHYTPESESSNHQGCHSPGRVYLF